MWCASRICRLPSIVPDACVVNGAVIEEIEQMQLPHRCAAN